MDRVPYRHQLCPELTFGPLCISWISITANISLCHSYLHICFSEYKTSSFKSKIVFLLSQNPHSALFVEIFALNIYLICGEISEEFLLGHRMKRMERIFLFSFLKFQFRLSWLDTERLSLSDVVRQFVDYFAFVSAFLGITFLFSSYL